MKQYSTEQKAQMVLRYAITNASTTQEGVTAFNSCTSQIKSCTYTELCALIDGELA